MSTTVMNLDGTNLTMVIAVVPRHNASGVSRALDELVTRIGPDPSAPGWRVLSRSEALIEFPNAWDDAPDWAEGNPDDHERMAWLRERLSGPVTTGFAHLATLTCDEPATATELAEIAGFANAGGWRSALSHAAVLSRRVGRKPVWGAKRIGGVWRYYLLDDDVRALWDQNGR